MEIKNLKKAAKRILSAIKKNERIILYGDADLDGVTSVIILKETIQNLSTIYIERGVSLFLYFPDREKEGYGITTRALKYLSKKVPALFIALDCGIGNFKEVKLANKIGFEVIIIDHHEVLDGLPEASIIIDPKQKGDKYPFKQLANVGIIFKLAELLLKKQMTESLRKTFLELVALATIADMMPRVNENKTMIEKGLSSLESSSRAGIQALLEVPSFKLFDLFQRVSKINSLLNVRDVQNQLPAAFRLLTVSEKNQAKKLAEKLLGKSFERREKRKEIIETVERSLAKNSKTADTLSKPMESIIFEEDSSWELNLLGGAASILSQRYQRPVFLLKKGKTESQSSIRAPSRFNLVKALKSCSKYLITYGGHPQAAGFRIKNKNLGKFKECLIKYFSKL